MVAASLHHYFLSFGLVDELRGSIRGRPEVPEFPLVSQLIDLSMLHHPYRVVNLPHLWLKIFRLRRGSYGAFEVKRSTRRKSSCLER